MLWSYKAKLVSHRLCGLYHRVCGLSLQPIGCTAALACNEQCYGSCRAASGAV